MPYAYDPNLDPNSEQNQPGQAPQLAGAGQLTGGASSSDGASSAAAGGNPKPTGQGNYQNLNDYLSANAGSGFGQQFAGKVSGELTSAQTAQDQGLQEFRGASDAGTVKPNQGVVDQAMQDPYAFTQNQSNVDAFKKQRDATYKGPYSYADDQAAYQKAYGGTQKAQDTTQAAQTEGGRFALLDNYFGNSGYSQGQKSLDNLLIQGDQSVSDALNQAKTNADQLALNFRNQQTDVANYAAQNAATTQSAAKYVKDKVTPAVTGLQSDYQTRLKDNSASQVSDFQNQLNALMGGDASAYSPILQQYGAGPAAGYQGPLQEGSDFARGAPLAPDTGYWGVTPGQFLHQSELPTLSSVTSLSDQQKLNALESLMGDALTGFDASQAGKYNAKAPGSFDAGGFNQAIQKSQSDYGQFESNAMANINHALSQSIQLGTSGSGTPMDQVHAYVQQQFDTLNAERAKYGLAPVKNTYKDWIPGTGTPPAGGGATSPPQSPPTGLPIGVWR